MGPFIKPKDMQGLQSLKKVCTSTGVPHGAGDGVCNMMDLMKLGQADKTHGQSQQSCTSKLALEAFDCVDNPLMKDDRAHILQYKRLCEKPHGKECMAKMPAFNTWRPKGGVCCPA